MNSEPGDPSGMTISEMLSQQGVRAAEIDLDDGGETTEHHDDVLGGEAARNYRIGEEVARGGMGAIRRARDLSLRRDVAMKLSLRNIGEPMVRFVEEAQITGQLEHPNIVPIHELGIDAHGRCYYTMKFIHGRTLKDILEDIRKGHQQTVADYPLQRLLNVFLKACDAVSFAHSKRVIHRDLKPENIMVGDYGEVLVLDWGLAKILKRDAAADSHGGDQRPSASASATPAARPNWVEEDIDSIRQSDDSGQYQTMDGQILGTPAFMAPEQAGGQIEQLDERTDIYALGGVLYNILTLHAPVEAPNVNQLLIKVVKGDIPHPSTYNAESERGSKLKGQELAKARDLTLLRHCPGRRIPSALAAVAMKALALEPDDRYASLKDLQTDIEQFQGGFATIAEQAGLLTHLRLLIGRHRLVAGISAISALLLVGVVTVALARISAERNSALSGWREAEHERDQAAANLAAANQARAELEREGYFLQLTSASANINSQTFSQAQALLSGCPEKYRRWEWHYLNRLAHPAQLTLSGHEGDVFAIAVDRRHRRLASASRDGTLRLWSLDSGTELRRWTSKAGFLCVAFSPDGERLAGGDCGSGEILIWRTDTGDLVRRLAGHSDGPKMNWWSINTIDFHPSGKTIASGGLSGSVKIWDATDGRLLHSVNTGAKIVRRVCFSPEGQRLATVGDDQPGVYLWDPDTGQRVSVFEHDGKGFFAMAYDPRGRYVAAGGYAGALVVWDVAAEKKIHVSAAHPTGWLNTLAFSPDGAHIVSGGADKTLQVVATGSWKHTTQLIGHSAWINSVAFLDDHLVASSSRDQLIMLWDLNRRERREFSQHGALHLAFSPDSKQLVSGGYDAVDVWDVFEGESVARLTCGTYGSYVAVSPNGRLVAAGLGQGKARLWDLASGELLWDFRALPDTVQAITFSPDGKFLAVGGRPGLALWRVGDQTRVAQFDKTVTEIGELHFAADGRQLTAAGIDAARRYFVCVWDLTTGNVLREAASDGAVLFGPDDWSVCLLINGNIQVLRGEQQIHELKGHGNVVMKVGFSPDGTRLASGSFDGVIKLWALEDGHELLSVKAHAGQLRDLRFSPDGNWLASCSSNDNKVRLWDGRALGKQP